MADLRFEDKNNQKKSSSVFASGLVATSATMNETLFTLPEASLVTNIYAVVDTVSGTATDTIDIKIGAVVVADEVVVGTDTTKRTELNNYYATGGIVTVVAGADAPDADGRIKIVVEYIETELANGQYTD